MLNISPKNLPPLPKLLKRVGGLHSEAELRFMIQSCKSYAPKIGLGVNLGVLFGRSTSALCYALGDGRVVGIDNWSNKRFGKQRLKFRDDILNTTNGGETAQKKLSGIGYHPKLITSDSRTPPDNICDVAVLFIDTVHQPDFLQQEYEVWVPRLVPNALVMIHDYGIIKGRRPADKPYSDAIDELFTTNEKWRNCGVCVTTAAFVQKTD